MKKKSKEKKTSTKLKTKLVATLVAIISVIAVMGVGVFASLANFSVVVTNGVNISFLNLSGTISVSAESGTDNLGTAGPKLNETVLYSAGTTHYTKISVNDTAGENLKYAGANFLTTEDGGITNETKAGVVAYTFKYTPVSTSPTAANVKIMVDEESKPTMSGGDLVTAYFVSLDGSTWAEIASKKEVVPANENKTIYVLAICQYLNQNLVATKSTQTAWNFNLTMWSAEDEVVELTYDNALLELTDGLSDGVGLSEDFVQSTPEPVKMNVSGLSGSVSVSAESGADDKTGSTSLPETTIYSNGNTYHSSISSGETDNGNLNYVGTDFLNETTESTENSTVVYTFKHTPESSQQGVSLFGLREEPILRAVASSSTKNIRVVINETARPSALGGKVTTGYFVSADGNTWAEIKSGEAVIPVAETEELYIRAICQYSNPFKALASFNQSFWNFELSISAVVEAITNLVYDNGLEEVVNGIVDGIALKIAYGDGVYDLNEDKTYIYFGEYPQSLKASDVTVSSTPDTDGYYLGSDGERYYKHTIDLSILATWNDMTLEQLDEYLARFDQLDASTGEEMKNGGTYYFKMEKIKWRVLGIENGIIEVIADTNLRGIAYQLDVWHDENYDYWTDANGAPEGTYANNYEYSELRRYMNNDFYNMSFNSSQKSLIQTVEVDNSAPSTGYDTNEYVCEKTFDKLYALSQRDINEILAEIGLEKSLAWLMDLETSDFAKATGAWTNTQSYFDSEGWSAEAAMTHYAFLGCGGVWLRSPSNDNSFSAHCLGYGNLTVYYPGCGLLPALQIRP